MASSIKTEDYKTIDLLIDVVKKVEEKNEKWHKAMTEQGDAYYRTVPYEICLPQYIKITIEESIMVVNYLLCYKPVGDWSPDELRDRKNNTQEINRDYYFIRTNTDHVNTIRILFKEVIRVFNDLMEDDTRNAFESNEYIDFMRDICRYPFMIFDGDLNIQDMKKSMKFLMENGIKGGSDVKEKVKEL